MKPREDQGKLLAVVTIEKEFVTSGAATVFRPSSPEMAEQLCGEISRALRADVVKLSNGTYLLLKT